MGGALPTIWIITQPENPRGPIVPLESALRNAPPGRVGVQLRAPGVADRRLVEWGHSLRALTAASGTVLTVNRRWDVAKIVAADGVHLPESGLSPAQIRDQWPEIRLIGVSRHDRAGLHRARTDGANFAFLSPVGDVPGKGKPMGVRGFSEAIAGVGIPTFALGGVGADEAGPLVAAGAHGLAARRAIYHAKDPEGALRRLVDAVDNARLLGE